LVELLGVIPPHF